MTRVGRPIEGTLRYHDDSGSYLVDCNGNKCRVDPDRIYELSETTWCQHRDGYFRTNVFDKIKSKNRIVKIHHMVIGYPPEGLVCDHINNDKSDNRLCNLQFITRRENCTKDRKNKGIWFDKTNKLWVVRINLPKKSNGIHLGRFETKEEAYDQRERALAIIETCTREDLIELRNKYKRKRRSR